MTTAGYSKWRCSNHRLHITPILISLLWLPVAYRIQCKILSIYKALHGLAPAYVMDLRHPSSSACSLRTKNLKLITVPCSRIWTHGDRAFEVVAPRLWNSLPMPLKSAESLAVFSGLLTGVFPIVFTLIFFYCIAILFLLYCYFVFLSAPIVCMYYLCIFFYCKALCGCCL